MIETWLVEIMVDNEDCLHRYQMSNPLGISYGCRINLEEPCFYDFCPCKLPATEEEQ